MNHRLLIIGLSLAANVALGSWLLLRPPAPGAVASAAGHASASTPAPTAALLSEPITAATWSRLNDGSPDDYARRLRTEDLPPTVVRALLRSRLAAPYAERLRALLPSPEQHQYWRRNFIFQNMTMTPEARAERRQITGEMIAAMKALGGDNETLTPQEQAARERRFGRLASSQVEQVTAIQRDYNDLRSQLREDMQGVTLPEDRAQLRLLDREQRADLAAVLTPDELLEYELRNSDSANQARYEMRYFEPTEAEYRALVQLRLAFDRQFGSGNLSEPEQAARRSAEPALREQIRGVLGADRFAEYELTANADFRNTVTALNSYNFDLTVAREVMLLRRDIKDRATAVEANALYDPAQRAAELAALHREATSRLEARLGAKGYEAFSRSGAGNWLRQLQPKPAPNAAGGRP